LSARPRYQTLAAVTPESRGSSGIEEFKPDRKRPTRKNEKKKKTNHTPNQKNNKQKTHTPNTTNKHPQPHQKEKKKKTEH